MNRCLRFIPQNINNKLVEEMYISPDIKNAIMKELQNDASAKKLLFDFIDSFFVTSNNIANKIQLSDMLQQKLENEAKNDHPKDILSSIVREYMKSEITKRIF